MTLSNPVVVQLSGGLDSTWCAYTALEAGRTVLIHHIRLVTAEGRADVEDAATERIVAWFRQQGFTFEYHKTSFDYGTLRPNSLDLMIWSLTAGLICTTRAPRRKDYSVMIGAHRVSNFAKEPWPGVIQTIIDTVARRKVRLEWPMLKLSKAEILADLPDELVSLCWWCRTPKNGEPCLSCRACRTYASAAKQSNPPRRHEVAVSPKRKTNTPR